MKTAFIAAPLMVGALASTESTGTMLGSSTIPEVYDLADNVSGSVDYLDVEIDQFDPALGTLQSVTMSFAGDWNRDYSYENESTSLREMNVTFDQVQGNPPRQMVEVLIGSFLEDLNTITLAGGVNVGSFAAYDGTTDFAGASGGMHTASTDAASSPDTVLFWDITSVTITDSGVLSALTGTGTEEIDILMDASYQGPKPCSNCISGVSTDIENVVLVVTYNYN